MARPKIQPDYNANQIMNDLINAVVESYEKTKVLKLTAKEFNMSAPKVRKMLITAGVYHSEIIDRVNDLYKQGMSIDQMIEITGLKKSSISGYLPYSKIIYKPEMISVNANRIKVYRERKEVVDRLQKEVNNNNFWNAIIAFQNYPFHTYSGLPFSYTIKVGKNGELNKELLINRRDKSKSLTWSSIVIALEKALNLKGNIISRPKEIGDIRGISYIYPIFYRLGLIDVPEHIADIMSLQ